MKGKIFGVLMLAMGINTYALTLDEALVMAEDGNPDLKIKRLELEKKGLEVSKSRKNYLPKFSLGTSYLPVENEDENDGFGYTNINATLPIYTGGRRSAELSKSKIEEKIEIERLDILSLGIKEQVIAVYFDILNAKKSIEINNGVIETLGKQKQRLKDLYEGGKLIPKSELLKVETDILKSEALKYTHEQDLEVFRYELKILLGMEQDEILEIEEYNTDSLVLAGYEIENDVIKIIDDSDRASIERLSIELAEEDLKIARSNFLPKVDARAAYVLDYGYENSDDPEYGVGLTAKMDLFTWGSNADNYKQKKATLDQRNIEVQKSLDELTVELRSEYANMMSLDMQMRSEEKTLEISRENLGIDNLRYDNGLISSFEYLDSINELARAESNYVRLQRDLVLAKTRYEDLLK